MSEHPLDPRAPRLRERETSAGGVPCCDSSGAEGRRDVAQTRRAGRAIRPSPHEQLQQQHEQHEREQHVVGGHCRGSSGDNGPVTSRSQCLT